MLQDAARLAFVGAASAGTDHVDHAHLHEQSIHSTYAAGCNADADYVLAALAITGRLEGMTQGRYALGLIGFGHTGRRLAHRLNTLARILGSRARVVVYDPFLTPQQIARHHATSAPLHKALTADCISIHCSLTKGRHASAGMLDADALSSLNKNQVLINTARGEILAETAWRKYFGSSHGGRYDTGAQLIFDVWPARTDNYLVERCLIATPHIAGYDLASKR